MSEESKLRVCLANDSFPPTIDGVANVVLNYARIINDRFGTPIVATPKYPKVVDDYPFEVVRYASMNTARTFGYRSGNPFSSPAMQRLQSFKPDIIHSHCPMASQYLCRELRELTGAPLVFTYHTKFDIDIGRVIKMGFVKDAVIRSVVDNIEASDEVWVVTHGAGENLKNIGFRGQYRVMPNGVDFTRGAASAEAVSALNRQYDLPQGIPCFLFVGRMMWYKGIRIILEGLRQLKLDGTDFRMVFIGKGAEEEEMKALAEELEIAKECIFAGAVQDRELLRAWYSRADLFLFPSTFDTSGLVVREAAACALGAVMIRGSAAAEGSEEGRNCLQIEENSEDMARVLRQVCAEPDIMKRIGEAAQNELYASWEDMVAFAVKRYEELVWASRNGELPARQPAKLDRVIEMIGDLQTGMDKFKAFLNSAIDGL